jgi:hypothetical protein
MFFPEIRISLKKFAKSRQGYLQSHRQDQKTAFEIEGRYEWAIILKETQG